MAEVAFVVEEAGGGFGVGVPVYAPVARVEEGGAADGEDDGVHVVDRDGCEDHGFGAKAGVGGDEGPAFGAGEGAAVGVGGVAESGCYVDDWVGGCVEAEWGEVCREAGVAVERYLGEHVDPYGLWRFCLLRPWRFWRR